MNEQNQNIYYQSYPLSKGIKTGLLNKCGNLFNNFDNNIQISKKA